MKPSHVARVAGAVALAAASIAASGLLSCSSFTGVEGDAGADGGDAGPADGGADLCLRQAGGDAVTTLEEPPVAVAADATRVYAATKTQILKAPHAGAAKPELVAQAPNATALVTTKGFVAWLTEGNIRAVRKGEVDVISVRSTKNLSKLVASPDADVLVFQEPSSVSHCPSIAVDCPPVAVAPLTIATAMATSASRAYFIRKDDSSIGAATLGAGEPDSSFVVAGQFGAAVIAADDAAVYWAVDAAGDSQLRRRAATTTSTGTLATVDGRIRELVSDGDFVYAATDKGLHAVSKSKPDTCRPVLFRDGPVAHVAAAGGQVFFSRDGDAVVYRAR